MFQHSSITRKVLFFFFPASLLSSAGVMDFDLVAIVDCDQKAKQTIVLTLRNRANIDQQQIHNMAKSFITSMFPDKSNKKAVFLRNQTLADSATKVFWIRKEMVKYESEDILVGDFLKLLDIDLSVEQRKKIERIAPE